MLHPSNYSSLSLCFLGTTCLVAMLSDKELTIGNVGDSRGVLCDKDGNAIPLSYDHKPYQLKERKRIKKAGGSQNKLSLKPKDEMCNVCAMVLCCPLMVTACIACLQGEVEVCGTVQVSPGLMGGWVLFCLVFLGGAISASLTRNYSCTI